VIWDFVEEYLVADSYKGGMRDAILRLFSMLLKWIDGAAYDDARKTVEEVPQLIDARASFPTNLATFGERLSWKLDLLSRLIEPKDANEAGLVALVLRLRYGCKTRAIALLEARVEHLRRGQAHKLLQLGIDPDVLLRDPRASVPADVLAPEDVQVLRDRLRTAALDRFRELADELAQGAGRTSGEEAAVAMLRWLSGSTGGFALGVQAYERGQGGVEFRDQLWNEMSSTSGDEDDDSGNRVLLWRDKGGASAVGLTDTGPNSGLTLLEQRIGLGDEEASSTRASRLALLNVAWDWSVRVGPDHWDNVQEILRGEAGEPRLIVAILPWFPSAGQW
ncbi:MAG: hypothetical protein ACRD2L_09100, partial [Terriglobia bacterium]